MSHLRIFLIKVILLFSFSMLITACEESEPVTTATTIPLDTPVPTSTYTPFPPTATPIPMKAMVNGVGITVEEFEAELQRYLSAQGIEDSTDQSEAGSIVLEDMINQILFAEAAVKDGFVLDEEAYQSRLDNLISAAGGAAAFDDWLLENGYTQISFNQALERSIKAAWMRDQILAGVPSSAEQVYIRQILLYNSDQANQALAELNSGKDFATLAAYYDPETLGDLGWIPKDFLPHPAIEEAAFSLQPGEYSEVIETLVGFHIIQVVDKDLNHPLSPEARLIWQEKALRDWVAMQREQNDIIILSPQ